jgi:hypothetical protein
MSGYRCAVCGQFHDELPMDLATSKPASSVAVPETERADRVYLTDDICVIDDREFFIRGVLPLPVRDTEESFHWGLWARVEQRDFTNYLDRWGRDEEAATPPFSGWLDGGVKHYPGSDTLEVLLQPRGNNQRPVFTVVPDDHPLGIDQRHGIDMAKVHSFVDEYLARQ